MSELPLPEVTVTLVVHDGAAWLPGCLASVLRQEEVHLELLILDSGSSDDSVALLRAAAAADPRIRVIVAGENVGYARGQDRLIGEARGAAILLLNQDVELDPRFLVHACAALAADPEIGSVQGRIRHLAGPGRREDLLDTTGLVLHRDRRVTSRAQGMADGPAHAVPGEVWGADGPAPVHRRAALLAARLPGRDGPEVLDGDFFMYKEDVDLAWRLRRLGWRTAYLPDAIAWHGRSAPGPAGTGALAAVRALRSAPPWIRALSWRNQRLMQVKNDPLPAVLRDLPWIAWRELASLALLLVADPRRLAILPSFLRLLPGALRKRRALARLAAAGPRPQADPRP